MATTSIWSVKSTLGHVIEYAEDGTKTANPKWSKSEYQSMRDVMDYAMNDFKTEQQYYVTALNCDAGCAREQMQLTKRQFGKTDGILAFHGYQSFAEGEVDADTAHAIGIKLAAELWPEYQVIVATHLNTHCFHNHFVLNSVSYLDGKKFNACKESYLKMRAASDRLCKEYGLSVITEHTAYYPKHYAEWDAERKGQPTWRSAIREDVDKAIMASMSFQAFLRSLKSMGYEVKTGVKHMAVRPPGKERFVRLRSLGERYAEDAIRQRILKQRAPERPAKPAPSIPLRIRVHGDFHLSKVTWKGLRALYFFYLRKLRRTQRAQQCNVPYALTSRTGSDSEYIQTSATYTSVGSFVSSVTDARGKSVSYGYNTDKGLRTSVTDANGNVAAYSYDSMNRLSGLTQGNAQVGYTYDDDELIGISHNGFSYGMTYDLFGHTLATKVNSDVLSQNTYDNSRGLLTSAQYGNGLNIHYEYDVLDRITEVRFGSTKMYSYSYDGDGNLQRMVDNLRDITTSYYYDLSGRLIRSASSDGSEYLYEYDLNDNLTKLHQSAGGSSWVTEYTYDKDNRPVTVKVNGKTITDSYNATGTRSSRVYGFATPYTVSFGYLAGANGSKTTMLQSYRNGSDAAYTYTYDNNGNVTAISQGTKSAAYTYDALNQLTRINDGFTNKTTTYTYDNAGNILERKEYAYTTGTLGTPTATFAYEYDSEWKDKLVSYNGETISYDEIGNPVSYRGYTMAWQGKRLESLSGNGLTASYTYDEQGIRSGKTINGVTTSFSYNGSLLMAQVAPEKSLLFSYDANGQAVSVNYNGTEYYYLRNGQNDIVGLMDESGVRVVEYIYDAWGKLISTTGTLATTLGADNPFRYRGYYYDTETGLYYLTTRYYDPEVCRFISADVYMSTGQGVLGGNMWAYCLNNPVNRFDTCGTWSMPNWLKITIGVAATALAVAITVSTGGAAAPVIVSVLSSTVGSAAISAVKSRIETGNWDNAGKAALDGASNGLMWGGIGALGGAAIKAVKYTRAVKETKAAAEALKYTKTAARHASERAYMNSTQTVKEIMNAAKPKPDKYIKNGLKWVVKGGMNKRDGMWELVVDSSRKTIVHFLFKT